jgi:hypothetical protein
MATIKYWNGAAWVATSIGAEVYSQPDMPASTTIGALWIDTDETPPAYSGGKVTQTYTITLGAADRTFNSESCSLTEVARVLATLINDMKSAGLM